MVAAVACCSGLWLQFCCCPRVDRLVLDGVCARVTDMLLSDL